MPTLDGGMRIAARVGEAMVCAVNDPESKRRKQRERSDCSWAPRKLSVRTVEDGKVRSESTMLTIESKIDPSISDSEFTKQRLESGL
jgi:hypothetical protein